MNPMIFAETDRLLLRSLEKNDLPRIVELIGDWEVARWLVAVPYPYRLKDAEDYYEKMTAALRKGAPEYFLVQRKSDGQQIGAVGLHPPREADPQPGEFVVGYWLGRDFWGQGLMSEALTPVVDLAFRRRGVALLTSTTDPANRASQNVLQKAGFAYLGIDTRRCDPGALRGSSEVTRWQLTREDYEKRTKPP